MPHDDYKLYKLPPPHAFQDLVGLGVRSSRAGDERKAREGYDWSECRARGEKKRTESDWGRGSSKSKSPVMRNIIFTLIISHSLSYKVRRRFAIRPEIESRQTNSHVAQICVTGHPF